VNSSTTHDPTAAGRLIRHLPALVFVVLVAVALIAFLLARRTVDDQANRILEERTGEVALVLESALAQIPAAVRPLGVAARLGDPSPQNFLDEARAEKLPAPTQSLALVRRAAGRLTVVAELGDGIEAGSTLSGPRAAAAQRALSRPEMTLTKIFGDAQHRVLGFAVGPPVTAPDTVIYFETPINPQAAPVTQQRPFEELDAVLYATPRATRDQIVITTTPDFPLRGRDVAQQQVKILGSSWLLTASARKPLVGSFANAVPWILLGIGLLVALVATAIVVALLRRRDYALALVDERTADLTRSLGQLEDAQGRLVLQERLAAIGEVAAAVGHELRNPLGVLTNSLYLIRATAPNADQPPTSRHLDTAEREISAAAAIVDSLLEFAREREPAALPVDLADLVEESLSVAPPPPEVGVVQMGLHEIPRVLADRQQLRQVLLNLLTNAYEAMDGAGVLTIEASTNGAAQVDIRVTDTGPGMDAETASRIFEPFFTRKAKGIGLGLPVTRRIVEKHGGSIAAESVPGHGATFVVTLPAAAVLDEVG
jgi:signal transduction histidine kinase